MVIDKHVLVQYYNKILIILNPVNYGWIEVSIMSSNYLVGFGRILFEKQS